MTKKSWVVYILKCKDGSLYTGITNDVSTRLKTHAAGKGSRFVRSRLPFKKVYEEKVKNKSAALKRELKIKSLSRPQKQLLVRGKMKQIKGESKS